MLGFKVIANRSRGGVERPLLAFRALSFDSFALSRTAPLIAIVPSTTEASSARPHAVRGLLFALMADSLRNGPSAAAEDVDYFGARSARSGVAYGQAFVTTGQLFEAGLRAIRYRVVAGFARCVGELVELCLATRAMCDNIGRTKAVIGFWSMSMALTQAFVLVAVEVVLTLAFTIELTSPAFYHRVGAFVAVAIVALMLVTSVFAKDVLLGLTAVASSRHSHLATAAQPLVAQPITSMLATRHSFQAHLTARPSSLVVCL